MKFQRIIWALPFLLIACAAPQKKGTATAGKKKMHSTKQDAKTGAKKATAVAPQAAKATGPGSVVCKAPGDDRSITRAVNEGGGCEVVYTKGGESKTVANEANDLTYCDQVVEKIRNNLVGAGFKCE